MYIHELQRTGFDINPGQDPSTISLHTGLQVLRKGGGQLSLSESSLRTALSEEPHFLLTEVPHWESRETGEK